ncbi:hypothetical protein OBBRIDRAFT_567986 [Obba rivulosa]|uniref:Uncharacterized protein n=1 Tax=Obba rivulosa TaxID=1052685 RepID=A0A8E2DKU0_9APHY|nr:hypothetical protein OBBRIDRAFT_567986 [Obba rivulosa]
MTLTILVSVSLLALVVTARPLVPPDGPELADPPVDIQSAVQAIFQSRTGHPPECLAQACKDEQDIRVHLTSSEEQDAYLSQLDGLDAIRAIVPLGLDGVLSDEEKELYQLLSHSKGETSGSLDELDGGISELPPDSVSPHADGALVAEGEVDDVRDDASAAEALSADVLELVKSPPLLVIALSACAALLVLLCVSVVLYTTHYVRTRVLASDLAYKIISEGAKPRRGGGGAPGAGEKGTLPEKRVLLLDAERADMIYTSDPAPVLDEEAGELLVSLSDEEDNEKFEDAQEHSLLFLPADAPHRAPTPELPRILIEEHPDPGLASLPHTPYSTPPPGPLLTLRSPSPAPSARRSLEMREISRPASPAWSRRASEASPLTLSAPPRPESPSSPRIPGALVLDPEPAPHAGAAQRSRAYRAPIPELDIAFALQLRPGLGVGADPAWLVRFLMAMFGWMAVFVGGGNARARRLGAFA